MKIVKVLGTEELFRYLDAYDLELDPHFDGLIGRQPKKAWEKFINVENQHLARTRRPLTFNFDLVALVVPGESTRRRSARRVSILWPSCCATTTRSD